MPKAINLPDIALCGPHAFGFFDDFDHFVTADRWTLLGDTGSTAAGTDAAGGILTLTGDGTDNDFAGVTTTHELFKVAEGKPIVATARVNWTEAATNEGMVVFGLAQEDTVGIIADDTGVPVGTLDGAIIYNPAATLLWSVCSSNATAQTITQTEHSHVSATWVTLRIIITPLNAADAEVTYWIDPNGGVDFQQMRENGSNPRSPAIKHALTITGLLEMNLLVGIKNGTAAAETLLVDYIQAWQKR